MTMPYLKTSVAVDEVDLGSLSSYMFTLMTRNVASDGFVFVDPKDPQRRSAPGCVIASPSYPEDLTTINQDYVYNWVRDAAVTALELAQAPPALQAQVDAAGYLDNYVAFAATCAHAAHTDPAGLAVACFFIDGTVRPGWPHQNDGAALQTLALLAAWTSLSSSSQATATTLIVNNIDFIVSYYQNANFNLWEEVSGHSLFTRAVQLKALKTLQNNAFGLPVPSATDTVIQALSASIDEHWNGSFFVSVLDSTDLRPGYDPNSDVISAAIYGALDVADARVLAHAALVRSQWADVDSPNNYAVNNADAANGLGPLIGRYPGDTYDGDTAEASPEAGHPWALCTANLAEFYYRLAATIRGGNAVPRDPIAVSFFSGVGIDDQASPAQAADLLVTAGDRMLRAILYHSDHLELSEQFDAWTGYEKSVRDLTWSYAAFTSALRARSSAGA